MFEKTERTSFVIFKRKPVSGGEDEFVHGGVRAILSHPQRQHCLHQWSH
jgi:hypothetical protein